MTRVTVPLRPVSNLAPKEPSLYPPQHQGRSRQAVWKEGRRGREGEGKKEGKGGREGKKVGWREGRRRERGRERRKEGKKGQREAQLWAWLGRAEH